MSFQTIGASIKANVRGIIPQGPAVPLMAQHPLLPVYWQQGFPLSSWFYNRQRASLPFSALIQIFTSELLLCSLRLPPPSKPHGTMLLYPAQPSPWWFSTLGHWRTTWSHQVGSGDRETCSNCGAALEMMSFWKPRLGIWTHFLKYMMIRLWFH